MPREVRGYRGCAAKTRSSAKDRLAIAWLSRRPGSSVYRPTAFLALQSWKIGQDGGLMPMKLENDVYAIVRRND